MTPVKVLARSPAVRARGRGRGRGYATSRLPVKATVTRRSARKAAQAQN